MNREQFDKLAQETIESTAKLLIQKGAEYAGDADRLRNFKEVGKMADVTPLQAALIFGHKHFQAICTYVKNDAEGRLQILSEPIEGRFDDMINYMILMKALIREKALFESPQIEKPLVTEPAGTQWLATEIKTPLHTYSLRPPGVGIPQRCLACEGRGTMLDVRINLPFQCQECEGTGELKV